MNKVAKIFVAVCAMTVAVLSIFALTSCGIGSMNYQTNTHEITEDFDKLSINVDTADVSIAPSEDGKVKVVCFERKNDKHAVSVEDGTLTLKNIDPKKWYQHIGLFSFKSQTVTVYLPAAEYASLVFRGSTGDLSIPGGYNFGDTDIDLSTGKINLDGSCFGALTIRVSTGKINLNDTCCESLSARASTGDITLKGVASAGAV